MKKYFTEEYARDILIDHPVDTDALVELIARIDGEMKMLYGAVSPQIAVVYGGYLEALNARRWHHPLFKEYVRGADRNCDAVFLRNRVRSQFWAIVRLKLFFRRAMRAFLKRFYAPEGGGYQRAKKHWEQSV